MILKKGRYRYNGFYENWKSVKLGNFVDVNPKSFLPRKFKYVDLESVVGTKLISFREEIRESAPSRAQRVAQKGDVFFQTVRPYQKNNYLFDLNEDNYVFSTGYAQLRPKVDSAFLLARLQEEGFVNKVIERCTGTSYPAINSKDLSRISITIPEHFEEQTAIGTLFRTLDDLLSSYKDNLANYQSLKATMLSKMFPKTGQTVPEIRLDGFDTEWECVKMADIFQIIDGDRGKSYPGESDFSSFGHTLFLDTGNVKKTGLDFSTTKFISEEKDKELRNGKLILGDFILTSRGTLGNVAYYNEDIQKRYSSVRINSAMLILRPLLGDKISPDYILAVLRGNLISNFMKVNQVGSAQPHITKKEFSKIKVLVPSNIQEQQAIGAYFSNLDNLINSYQEKISQLEIFKKKLLQDMFI